MRHHGAVICAFLIAAAAHAGIAVFTVPEGKPHLPVQEQKKSHLEISFVSAYKEVKRPVVPKPVTPPPSKRREKRPVVTKEPPREDKPVPRKAPAVKEVIRLPRTPMEEVERKADGDEEVTVREKPAAASPDSESPDTKPHKEAVLPAVPSYDKNAPPVYPRRARKRGYEGTVILAVFVTTDGTADKIAVKESSGHSLLDNTAVDAVQGWLFHPATRGGIPIAMWVDVPIRFVIERN